MKRPSQKLQKFFSIISGLSLVFNSILPGATLPLLFASPAYAQETTPIETPAETPTVEPTASETVAPTPDVTQAITETPTETPVPTAEATPNPTPEEVSLTPTEVAQPTETGPPAEGQILDGASTETPAPSATETTTPTPTITPEEPEQGQLAAAVLQNVEAESLNLDNIDPSNSATITTDKADYAPTDTAVISGTGFKPNHAYDLTVKSDDPPATSTTVEITTDEQGTFVYAYQLDGTYRPNYQVAVTNKGGKVIATTTFTDAQPVQQEGSYNLDQGKNGGVGDPPISPVEWVNGNLNSSGAHYTEGQSVPYRVILSDLPTGVTSTVKIEWDIRQSSKNAIDYISGPQRIGETVDPTIGVSGLGAATYWLIPTPSINATRIASFNALPTDNNNKRLWAYNVSSVTFGAYVNGSDAGANTSSSITISFTPTNSTVVLAWGGHIAAETDWGAGNGATSLPGSPYHTRILELCNGTPPVCGGGNQDRSLSAGAVVPPASITIVKDAQPDDDQDFAFTTTGNGLSSFTLDDNGNNADGTSNTNVFNNLLAGTYTVTETTVAGWSLGAVSCQSDGEDSTNTPVTDGISITLVAGENITCTFTNTIENGHIIIDKVTDPSGSTQSFSFDASGGTYADFALTDAAPPNDQELLPGTYSVAETVPSGWDLTSATCDDGSLVSAIDLAAGETVTCTFTNTQRGHIVVNKVTDPSGSNQSFDFTAGGTGYTNFSLTDAAIPNDQEVVPGAYSISEGTVAGWDSDGGSCDLGETPGSIDVGAGETVTCTFTNTQRGHIIVDKVTDPTGELQSFDFVATGSGYTNFSLTDAATPNDQSLIPGTYGVSETVPTGWDLTNTSCVSSLRDTETAGSLELDAGETITCTFTNTQRGSISGVKYEDADGDATTTGDQTVLSGWVIELWKWVTNAFVDTGLTDTTDANGAFSFENLLPGVYQLREVLQAGWTKIFPAGDGIDVTLVAGETDDENDFVNFENVSVTACKVADPDGLIATTDGRTNVAGWQVDLIKNANTIDDTRITAENGCYTWANLGPGDYSVSEATQSGWTNLNPTTHNFGVVQSGETYSHTFVNTQNGSITVIKQTDPDGSQQNFEFDSSYHNDNFLLTDGFFDLSGYLLPGTYSVAELTPAGWDLTSATCDDGSDPSSISLQAGEDILCTFTNTQSGHIIVDKVTDPAGDAQVFNFDATGGLYQDFALDDNDTPNDQTLVPGTYGVTETAVAGWELTDTTCISSLRDTETAASLELDAGETITCTFTNTALGNVIVVKYNDHDGDGVKDVEDEVLGDTGVGDEIEATRWEMHLVGTGVDAYQWTGTGDPAVAGQVTFSDLLPNSFTLSEQIKTGWALTNIACGDEVEIDDSNSHPIEFAAGQDVTCYVGNQGQGTIIVEKDVVPDSDETFDFTITGDLIEQIGFTLGDGDSTDPDYSDLPAGTYSVSETPNGLYTTNVQCVSSDEDTEVAGELDLNPGETITCSFTNTRNTGTIIVHKIIDPDGNLEDDSDQFPGENWEMDADGFGDDASDFSPQFTNVDGIATFSAAKTGQYNVRELNANQDGYELLDSYCDNGVGGESIIFISVGADETVNCTFINTPNGSIHGQKWNDLNGDGLRERGEPVLAGWKIFLDENDNQTWDEGEQFMLTDGDQELGWYWFEHLFPDTYTVCEEPQAGWVQTSSPQCHTVDVPSGENSCPGPEQLNSTDGSTCDFGNQELNPILTITKENNTGGANRSPGDNVLFTITVTATQSAAYDVLVTDLPSGGFTYRTGSWTSNNSNGTDLKANGTTTEPTYASPGVWKLGTIQPEEIVTLTYLADISNDQQPGRYYDLAWAVGCRTGVESCEHEVLAGAVNPGFVADNYVGTEVPIVTDKHAGADVKVVGEVLGASTELPATGANTFWLYVAFALLGGGLTLGALGWFLRRKYA